MNLQPAYRTAFVERAARPRNMQTETIASAILEDWTTHSLCWRMGFTTKT